MKRLLFCVCLVGLSLVFACKSTDPVKNAKEGALSSREIGAGQSGQVTTTNQGNGQANSPNQNAPNTGNTGGVGSSQNSSGNLTAGSANEGSSGSGSSGSGGQSQKVNSQVLHSQGVRIKERSDYRTYINGKYSGLTYREAETYLQQKVVATGTAFAGKTFVVQDTRRNLVSQARRLDQAVDIAYIKRRDGSEVFSRDSGFPLLRSFFDTLVGLDYVSLKTGTWWETEAKVSVLPLKEESPVVLPVLIRYEYAGLSTYLETPVYKVVGKYALRYNGEERFSAISGTRDIEIFIDILTNQILFVREKTLEQFTYKDGRTIKNDGTLLHFYEYSTSDKTILTGADNSIIGVELHPAPTDGNGTGSGGSSGSQPGVGGTNPTVNFTNTDNYTVENTDLGLQIRLQNLRFVADQAVLLPGEEKKLDEIANILKGFPGKTFFVEGHTASTGRPNDEKVLSEERAQHIVAELVKRGLPAQNFLYSGAGATKPLADNTTDAGKAKNRRVEITILD